MKKPHLLTTVAAGLLLTAGAAAAQGVKDQAPERAPAAQQAAPAEKMAPPLHADERKATKSADRDKSAMKNGSKSETTGQATKSAEPGKTDMNSQNGNKGSASSGANVKANESSKTGASPSKSSQSVNGSNATVGQGAAAGAANLSSTQRTKITTIIRQKKVQPTHLNISVRVGARIPESVHFYPLPVEVVDVYPAWRGYDYILVGDEIIVVNPHTHMIVAVLEA